MEGVGSQISKEQISQKSTFLSSMFPLSSFVRISMSHCSEIFFQIAIVTITCASSFVLHCIFTLIQLNVQNIIFSFIGLTITEIIPSLYLLASFDKVNGKGWESGSRRNNSNNNNNNSNTTEQHSKQSISINEKFRSGHAVKVEIKSTRDASSEEHELQSVGGVDLP